MSLRSFFVGRLPGAPRASLPMLSWGLPCIVVLGAYALPALINAGSLRDYAMSFRSTIFVNLIRRNPFNLLFPLLCVVPYAIPFHFLVVDRFLASTRIRIGLRATIARHLLACAVVNFCTFSVACLIPAMLAAWSTVPLEPAVYFDDVSPAGLAAAELTSASFGEFSRFGEWGIPVAYAMFFGIHAILYGCISVCLILLQSNRVVAFLGPWVLWMVSGFVFAWLGLERVSTDLVMPFNLKHIPIACLLSSYLVPVILCGSLVGIVLFKIEDLAGCR